MKMNEREMVPTIVNGHEVQTYAFLESGNDEWGVVVCKDRSSENYYLVICEDDFLPLKEEIIENVEEGKKKAEQKYYGSLSDWRTPPD